MKEKTKKKPTKKKIVSKKKLIKKAKCVCFRCKEKYLSSNEDDIAGDGKCKSCKEVSAEIAKKVDENLATIRATRSVMPNTPMQGLYFDQGN
jgi:hypothetical protein